MTIHDFRKRLLVCGLSLCCVVVAGRSNASAKVISGTITNWEESGPSMAMGDGVHDVHAWWTYGTLHMGWFYGSALSTPTRPVDNVAYAGGVSNLSQIDVSALTFTTGATGTHCDAVCARNREGDFIVWRNAAGYYAVMRIDAIFVVGPKMLMNATWWFQTDGTANFATAVCEIGLNKAQFGNGDQIMFQVYRFANETAGPIPIEYKVWLDVPGAATSGSITRGGAQGTVQLPAGFDVNAGPISFITVTPQFPRGWYNVGCRLLDPTTGNLILEDLNPFVVE